MLLEHDQSRASIGAHPWTLPVPGPEVDLRGFGDLICGKAFGSHLEYLMPKYIAK